MSLQTQFEEDILLEELLEQNIIVFNDDINTFDHVISTFIDVLDHTPQQAEQCAWLIHHKGKCQVKSGSYDELQPKCIAILDSGISAKIL